MSTEPLRSQTLEETFRSLEAHEIRRWIAERRLEDLTLEFKTVPALLERSEERKVLAEAISGFSNSSGGLIVWGVDARKDSEGVDGAVGERILSDSQLMLTNLLRHSGTAVSPTAAGVVHRLVASGEFAVTLVPESDYPPHMAKFGVDRYFKRSGDSFYRMEHFDLADMFGRRRRSVLEVEVRRKPDGRIVASILNLGRGTARGPYLKLMIPEQLRLSDYGIDGNGSLGLPRLPGSNSDSRAPEYAGSAVVMIHPGTRLEVAGLDPKYVPPGRYEINYLVAAEDFPLAAGVTFLTL